ncbi:DUF222 domain-containing protein [Corynebacterium argentoratense]|uniref:DUF222 domain-containing protein n=1 Tax=Corynebacterium argentoratense TaxID=42817 RepID=UPI003C6F9E0C
MDATLGALYSGIPNQDEIRLHALRVLHSNKYTPQQFREWLKFHIKKLNRPYAHEIAAEAKGKRYLSLSKQNPDGTADIHGILTGKQAATLQAALTPYLTRLETHDADHPNQTAPRTRAQRMVDALALMTDTPTTTNFFNARHLRFSNFFEIF